MTRPRLHQDAPAGSEGSRGRGRQDLACEAGIQREKSRLLSAATMDYYFV
jgi:hypothetical protein